MPLRSLALASVLALALPCSAQNASSPQERILRATEASSLDTLIARPWHARLDITVFDPDGKNPVEGTIDYSKSGDDWLRVTAIGADKETFLHHEGKSFHSRSGAFPSAFVADTVAEEFLHPGPTTKDVDASTPELRKQNFGSSPLDCIMLSRPVASHANVPLGLFPTYCLDPGTVRLRAAYSIGSTQITLNSVGRFLDHDVAMAFSLAENGVVVAKAKLATLATFTPTPTTFTPAPEWKELVVANSTARISSAVMQAASLKKVQPAYPEAARRDRMTGTVLLRAIIDEAGKVRRLQVVSTPDPSLALAAIAAVRQWTYKPYLLNAEPTDVDTTVIVNFNINP